VILVAGGTGFVGAAVVRRVKALGADVAVMTAHPGRSSSRIDRLGARPVIGDVTDRPSLDRAVRGMDAVVQSLTFPTFPVEKASKGYTFEEFDHHGTARLVAAAAEAGVERYVYASGVNVGRDAPKVWFRAKWFGEEAIRATGIAHAIVRPSWAFGPEDRALNRLLGFARWLPFVPVVGDGRQRLQPVFIDDVAEVLARAALPGGPEGTFEIGGPDVLAMNEVLHMALDVMGRRRPLLHFPVWMPKTAGFFAQVLPRPPLSPDAVDFLLADAVADTGPLLEAFDGLRLTPLRDGLATYLLPR
jgi:NADH dehydrogenase